MFVPTNSGTTSGYVNYPATETSSSITFNNGCGVCTTAGWTVATDRNTIIGNQWNFAGNIQTGGLDVKHWEPVETPKNHCGVSIRSYHRDRQFDHVTPAEMLALQLLRKMVGQDEFRRYLKHGFILARGPSGLSYQIARRERIVVREYGNKLATLCVHLKYEHKTPPTDEVVAKLLMVECDEADLWQRSNVTWLTAQRHEIAGDKADQRGGFVVDGDNNNLVLGAMG